MLKRLFMPLVATIVAPGAAQLNPPPVSPDRAILTEKECFLILPQELIAAPTVQSVSSSGGGRYLLAQRASIRLDARVLQQIQAEHRPPGGETSLVLWDSQTRQSREVWKGAQPENQIARVQWIPQTDTALILVRQMLPPDPRVPQKGPATRNGLLRLTPSMEKAQVVGLTDVGDDGYLDLWVSPVQPIAVLHHVRSRIERVAAPGGAREEFANEDTLHVLNETGRIVANVALPKGAAFNALVAAEDGGPVVETFKIDPAKHGLTPQFFALNPRTGALTPMQKAPEFRGVAVAAQGVADYPVRIRQATATAKDDTNIAKVGLLWLESAAKTEQPRVLIAAGAENAQILPRGDVVVYHAQGSLWAAPLLRIDKAMYVAMREAAERAVILSNAKQLGLAVMMYAQDYDETFPGPDGINAKLTPYLKNASLFDGLSYTYGGGSISAVEKPAETELGYVTGPGGRAVIYADGHVKWRPDR
jgi:hypothetical protein